MDNIVLDCVVVIYCRDILIPSEYPLYRISEKFNITCNVDGTTQSKTIHSLSNEHFTWKEAKGQNFNDLNIFTNDIRQEMM